MVAVLIRDEAYEEIARGTSDDSITACGRRDWLELIVNSIKFIYTVSTTLLMVIQEIGKNAKVIVFGLARPMEYDSLKDLIGIVKAKKQLDVEELIDLMGFEDARKHLEF
jgi:hypothetical protein